MVIISGESEKDHLLQFLSEGGDKNEDGKCDSLRVKTVDGKCDSLQVNCGFVQSMESVNPCR